MKKIFFILGMLLIASSAQAQHTCDKPQLSGNIIVSNTTFLFAACHPLTEDADGIVIELDGVKTAVAVSPAGAPNATGKVAYNIQVIIPANGNHTVRTAAYTLSPTGVRQDGPLSNPFVLVFAKPTPVTATTNHLR